MKEFALQNEKQLCYEIEKLRELSEMGVKKIRKGGNNRKKKKRRKK